MIYEIQNELPSRFPNVPLGVTYDGDNFFATISANDPQGECIEYSISSGILPYGAIFDPLDGTISGILKLRDISNTTTDCHDHTWTFTVRATNNLDYSDQDFSITVKHVNVPPLWVNAVVNNDSIPIIDENITILGEHFAFSDINIEFNVIDYQCLPVSFSLINGIIPDGLSLSNNGVISGNLSYVPRENNKNYHFTIMADDGVIMNSQAFFFTSKSLERPPIWGENTFDSLYPSGATINYTANAIQLDGYPLTYSLVGGALPSGITLSSSGLISGTSPTVTTNNTTYTFTIRADDGIEYIEHVFTITLYRIYWVSPNAGDLGVRAGGSSYNFVSNTVVVNPVGPTIYTVQSGSLPTGTILNQYTGIIYGTLSNISSTYSFTLRATNNGVYDDRSFTGSVAGITVISWVSPPSGPVLPNGGASVAGTGIPYNFISNVAVTNPVGPTVYSVYAGSLPSGTSLNPETGVISGLLTNAPSTYAFTIRATNNGKSANRTFTGNVVVTSVTWNSPAAGNLGAFKGGTSYDFMSDVTVSNPFGPTTFSISEGSLPDGIRLNSSTGVVFGIMPIIAADYSFTIRVTNNGAFSDRGFSLSSINPQVPPVWITPEGSIGVGTYTESRPFDFQFSASDENNDVLTYSLSSGSFPIGLSLSSSGNLAGIPRNQVAQTSQDYWIIVGTPLGNGHYDGRDIKVTNIATDYMKVQDGYVIFESKPNDAPFVSTNSTFVPKVNIPYTITYKIKKIAAETNGIKSYIKPAFDAEDSNGILAAAQGTKSGYGYDSALDMIDTSAWVIGTIYDISVTWTPAIDYVYARGRVRINRSIKDDNIGTYPYSDAVFQIVNQEITYSGNPSIAYNFTINVSDGIASVPREFSMIIGAQYAPVWVTPAGSIGTYTELVPMSFPFSATDINNDPLMFAVQSGELPSGLTLSSSGILSGTPINAVTQLPLTDWKIIGASIGNGHWDVVTGTNATVQQSAVSLGYSVTNIGGNLVLTSKPKDSPFVSSDSTFVPTMGQSYKITYKIKKIVAETNGIKSYIKPAFDTYYANGALNTAALGNGVVGNGYVEYSMITGFDGAIANTRVNAYDTTSWQIGTTYEVSTIWTPSTTYDSSRGRLRVNRSFPDITGASLTTANAAIYDYADAVFEISNQTVSYVVSPDTNYNFEINVTDGISTVARSFELSIHKGATSIIWNSPAPGNLGTSTGGTSYLLITSISVINENGPTTYSIQNGALPEGTSLNTTTGIVSGVLANVASSYSFTIRVTNNGVYADRSFSGTVIVPPIWQTASGPLAFATADQSYSTTLLANIATSYTVVSGSLPNGLSLNTSTGAISGTPTIVQSNIFVVRATGSNSLYSDREFSISVRAGATIISWNSPTAGSLGSSKGDTAFSFVPNVSVINPVGSTSYSITAGALPSGTYINPSNGIISGTLTNTNTSYSFTIRATNNNVYVERTFTGTIIAQIAPVWSTPSGTIGTYVETVPMNFQFSANDANNDPLSYALISGNLANGLTLSSSGKLSGTPINQVSQAPLSSWLILGTSIGNGHWDATGTNATVQQSAINLGYSVVNINGNIIFESKPKDAPFISADSSFVPIINQAYKITYKIKKIVKETNGIKSYIKPAFDTYYANGALNLAAQGTAVSGNGYTSSITIPNWSGVNTTYNVNGYDTTNWQIGTIYEVSSVWTPTTSDLARGRIRINRSYPDTVGPDYTNAAIHDYSDAVFQVYGQEISYLTSPSSDYNFDIYVTDGMYYVRRSFALTVIKGQTTVSWISPAAGALGASAGGTTYILILEVSVTNPVGPTTYSIISGLTPTGTSIDSATGVISGTLPNTNASYAFTVRATNNGVSSDRYFSGTYEYTPTGGGGGGGGDVNLV